MKATILFTAIILFFVESSLLSQDHQWQLTLANGDTVADVSLQQLEGDSLEISNPTLVRWVSVDSIVELRKVNKSRFWKGAGIGFLLGTTTGALIGLATYQKPDPSPDEWNFDFGPGFSAFGGGIAGGLSGFWVGGLIGSSMGKDEIYPLSQMEHRQKLNTIWSLISR